MRPPTPLTRAATQLILAAVLACPALARDTPGGGGRPDFREPSPAERARPSRARPAVAPGVRAELVDLRPRFHVGEDLRYRVLIRSVSDVTLPGGLNPGDPLALKRPAADRRAEPRPGAAAEKPRQHLDQEITIVLRPRSVEPEGAAVVDLVYERVRIRYEFEGDTMEFDSAAKPTPADAGDPLTRAGESLLAQLAGGLAGTTMTLTLDNQGAITKVDGGGALGLPGGLAQLGAVGTPSTGELAESLIGPIRTRSSGGGLVKVGDRWTNEDDLSVGPFGAVRMSTSHTVGSADAKAAVVLFTGHAASRSEDKQAPVSIDEATYRGRYDWDTRQGRLKSLESEQETRLTLRATGGETTSASTTTVRVEPVGP